MTGEESPRGDRQSPARESDGDDRPVSSMRARRWVIASLYSTPEEYGVPTLPEWVVRRTEGGGLSLAAAADSDPFLSAERPVRVRR